MYVQFVFYVFNIIVIYTHLITFYFIKSVTLKYIPYCSNSLNYEFESMARITKYFLTDL